MVETNLVLVQDAGVGAVAVVDPNKVTPVVIRFIKSAFGGQHADRHLCGPRALDDRFAPISDVQGPSLRSPKTAMSKCRRRAVSEG